MSATPQMNRCYCCRRKFFRRDRRPATITHGCGTTYTICARCCSDDRKVIPPCPVCKLALSLTA